MGALAQNVRVVVALGRRSIRQTFRRPQLMAPIIIFPTLLLAVQTGGASGAVDLPGFPEVNGFLDFMLAGAMIQSCLLAGNSGGIALAVDIEMGFTDRLLAAPISRFAMVLGRLAGTAALGTFSAVYYLVLGLIFGAQIEEGVLGVLLMIALRDPFRDRVRRDRRGHRDPLRLGLRRPGPLPARLRDPVPLVRVLSVRVDAGAGGDDRRVQPGLVHRRGSARSR